MAARVSIVVPCYNGGRFLPGLLACLAEQRFRDFSVTIVDDGSTDPDTIAALDAMPEGIRVLRQGNRGLPGARNAGMAAADTDLLLPLDCDDRLDPLFLARTVAALDQAGPSASFAYADIRVTGAHEGIVGVDFRPFGQRFINRMPYCLLMRRKAWERAGGYDESMRQGYEDWEFSLRLLESGAEGVHVAEPLFVYHASLTGMLLGGTVQRHGQVWRQIRERHRGLYAWGSLWHAARSQYGRWPALPAFALGAGLLAATRLLPYRLQNALALVFLRGKHAVRSALTGRRASRTQP